jgi:hypothetical protein
VIAAIRFSRRVSFPIQVKKGGAWRILAWTMTLSFEWCKWLALDVRTVDLHTQEFESFLPSFP